MFDLLTVQLLAEERVKNMLCEAERARLIRQVRRHREPQRWWSAVASFLERLPILAAHPQSAFAGLLNSVHDIVPRTEPSHIQATQTYVGESLSKETVERLPVGCC